MYKLHTESNYHHVSESFLHNKTFDVFNYECSEIRLAFRVICELVPDLLPKEHLVLLKPKFYANDLHILQFMQAIYMFAREVGNHPVIPND